MALFILFALAVLAIVAWLRGQHDPSLTFSRTTVLGSVLRSDPLGTQADPRVRSVVPALVQDVPPLSTPSFAFWLGAKGNILRSGFDLGGQLHLAPLHGRIRNFLNWTMCGNDLIVAESAAKFGGLNRLLRVASRTGRIGASQLLYPGLDGRGKGPVALACAQGYVFAVAQPGFLLRLEPRHLKAAGSWLSLGQAADTVVAGRTKLFVADRHGRKVEAVEDLRGPMPAGGTARHETIWGIHDIAQLVAVGGGVAVTHTVDNCITRLDFAQDVQMPGNTWLNPGNSPDSSFAMNDKLASITASGVLSEVNLETNDRPIVNERVAGRSGGAAFVANRLVVNDTRVGALKAYDARSFRRARHLGPSHENVCTRNG
jgi:hypothetical protein